MHKDIILNKGVCLMCRIKIIVTKKDNLERLLGMCWWFIWEH